MAIDVRVDAFVEDRAHEQLIGALIRRLADDCQISIRLNFLTAKGGHPRVLNELTLYRRTVDTSGRARPDVLVVGIDANCKGWNKVRGQILEAIGNDIAPDVVVACPDPHVERWFMVDPDSFSGVVGHRPSLGRAKCERDKYKQLLGEAVRKGGSPALLGGIDFAPDLVAAMDLYRAAQTDRSFGHFVSELRACFVRWAQRND